MHGRRRLRRPGPRVLHDLGPGTATGRLRRGPDDWLACSQPSQAGQARSRYPAQRADRLKDRSWRPSLAARSRRWPIPMAGRGPIQSRPKLWQPRPAITWPFLLGKGLTGLPISIDTKSAGWGSARPTPLPCSGLDIRSTPHSANHSCRQMKRAPWRTRGVKPR